MKKILLILFIIPLVYAIVDGQRFNQAELNNVDIDSIDLECAIQSESIASRGGDRFYKVTVSCFTINKLYNITGTFPPHVTFSGIYEVKRENHILSFRLSQYVECVNDLNASTCNPIFIEALREQHRSEKRNIREKAKSWQNEEDFDMREFNFNLGD